MKHNRNQLARAVSLALGVGTVAGMAVVASPVVAQEEDVADLDRVQVTGTRITRMDIEGAQPVTVISREDLDVSGDTSIAEFLNRQTFNTFGSFVPASGFAGGAQGQASISLRALGSGRTLVLIDGRRIANTPAFAGAAQNLTALPMALVERVEILREGASAVYGTDAIGGVINIITRKDFEGVQLSGQIERPSQSGGDAHSYSLIAGTRGDRGHLQFFGEHFEKDIIGRFDRDYLHIQEPSPLGGPGSFYRVADRAAPVAGFIPSPNIPGAIIEPDPSCPADFDGPDFRSSARRSFPLLTNADVLCLYRFTDDAGQTAAIDRDVLNTMGGYEFSEKLEGFMRINSVRNQSFGRFAAAPVTPVLGGLTMSADNVFNITADEPGGPHDLVFLFRPVAGGPRDSTVTDQVTEVNVGLRGEVALAGFTEWEVSAFHNRYTQNDVGINYGLRPLLQDLVDRELLNPFDPDPATFAGFAHTILTDNEFRSYGYDAVLSFDDIGVGRDLRVPVVVGGTWSDEKFFSLVDQQSEAGNVFGSAGSTAGGDRTYWAVFAETALEFFDGRFEFGAAARYDNYSDFGGQVSPKFHVSFRPLNTLLLRASYGEGFAAPSLEILNRQPAQSFPPGLIDRLGCQIDPDNVFACVGRQRETFFTNNPNLGPEESENWNVGLVFTPLNNLSFSLDYFDITIDDGIANLSAQNVLDNEFRCFNEGRACDPFQEGQVIRTAPATQGGQVLQIIAPAANFTVTETQGVDFQADWSLNTDAGLFRFHVNTSHTFSFERSTAPLAPLEEVTRSVGAPKWRGQARASWALGDLQVAGLLNHIPSMKDCTVAQMDQGHPNCERHFASMTTLDLQIGYTVPWGGEFVLGARNVFDRDPPLSKQLGTPEAPLPDMGLHGIWGRVPYLRYTQTF